MSFLDVAFVCLMLAGPSLTLVKFGKFLDVRLGEHEIKSLKHKWKLESHWMDLAQQSWADLYISSATVVEVFLSKIFGSKIFSFRSIFRFLLFSFLLNVLLVAIPLIFAMGSGALKGSSGIRAFLGLVASFAVINSILDVCAYLATRMILRFPPKSMFKILACLFGVIGVAWMTVVLSLAVGGALAFIPMFDHFDFDTLDRIVLPLIGGWIRVGVFNPFHANVSLNGLSLSYGALGALPSSFVLFCILMVMTFLKISAQFFRKELCVWFGRLLDKKDGLFEYLGMFLSMVFILVFLVAKFLLWGLSKL
jgi:hypothetical protein